MPNPPPRFSRRTGAGAWRASSNASAADFCCASIRISRAQVLRAAEDVKAPELERQPGEFREQRGHGLRIDAELLRPAGHLHSGRLELEVGIHADRDPAVACPLRTREFGEPPHLERRLHVDDDAGGDGLLELGDGLARSGEADLGARHGRAERDVELRRGGDVEPVDQPGEMLDDAGQRIRLDRVVQLAPPPAAPRGASRPCAS